MTDLYNNDAFPERACDRCGRMYRGPAVYCSIGCAIADSGSPPLEMWTVYDHPRDFPDAFIARRWIILRGHAVATNDMFAADTLEELRALLPS